MINIDITLGIQIINFLVSLWIINSLIISPIRENMKRRQDIVAQDIEDSERFKISVEERLSEYDNVIAKVRDGIASQKSEFKSEAENISSKMISESEEKAVQIRTTESANVQTQSKDVYKILKKKVPNYSKLALGKILD